MGQTNMNSKPIITAIEIVQWQTELRDVQPEPTIGIPQYSPGSVIKRANHALRVHTDVGITGEYIGGSALDYTAIAGFARVLLGRNALQRENIYNDLKQAMRQSGRMGTGVMDIALWDVAGKYHDAPVYELLGGSQKKLPCYASTYVGDSVPGGLNCAEAYADFAEYCLDLGYPAFKIHGWQSAPIQEQIAIVEEVGKRVGGKMDLMLDPFCAINTFGDALKLGRACDEYNYFWYEDPFKDGGVSMHAHRKLRQMLKTPILQLEHVRGLESHVDFIEAEATDFVRADPDYDGGITGTMKIAHAAEGFGLDVELHVAGPDRRHLMASMRNTNYYEMGLLHPKLPLINTPEFKCDYRDAMDAIDENGCVDIPEAPGLGVQYDWDFIKAHETDRAVFN